LFEVYEIANKLFQTLWKKHLLTDFQNAERPQFANGRNGIHTRPFKTFTKQNAFSFFIHSCSTSNSEVRKKFCVSLTFESWASAAIDRLDAPRFSEKNVLKSEND